MKIFDSIYNTFRHKTEHILEDYFKKFKKDNLIIEDTRNININNDSYICNSCDYQVICDWWMICTGDCKVCEDHDAQVIEDHCKITFWCNHECAMRRWKDENDNRISN